MTAIVNAIAPTIIAQSNMYNLILSKKVPGKNKPRINNKPDTEETIARKIFFITVQRI